MKRILLNISLQLSLPFLLLDIAAASDQYLFKTAAHLYRKADYAGAISELKRISSESEKSNTTLEASYLIGMSHMARGEWGEAAGWFELSSKYHLLADYAIFNLGNVYFNSGRFEDAASAYSRVISTYPDSRWREEAELKRAESLMLLGDYTKALSFLEQFRKQYPRSSLFPKALLLNAKTLEKNGDKKSAHLLYKRLWISHPSSPESKEASESMKGPADSGIEPITLDERYQRASGLISGNLFRDSINELTVIIRDAEKGRVSWLAEAVLKLATAHYQVREFRKATEVLKKIPADSKGDILQEALFLTGKALYRSGDREGAVATFEAVSKTYPGTDSSAKALYLLADMAEGDGNVAKAKGLYRRIHGEYQSNSLADDAIWKEGWLNYLEKDYDTAYLLFSKLLSEYPSSEFVDTVTYWTARLLERFDRQDEAARHYSDLTKRFPMSYYSVKADKRSSKIRPIPTLSSIKEVNLPYTDLINRINNDQDSARFHLSRGKVLISLGLAVDASREFSLAESKCGGDKRILSLTAAMLAEAGDYFNSQRLAVNTLRELTAGQTDLRNRLWIMAFPKGFSDEVISGAERNLISPHLIHAIIREESSYRATVVSRAGAIGLMQIMPFTGKLMSQQIGLKDYSSERLYNPDTNIILGSLYIRRLLENHSGNLPLAVAAYNAGPNAVAAWINRFGTEDMDEFIENIPYAETRNYVKKVIRSYDIYSRIYEDDGRSVAMTSMLSMP